jgi:hypothetical protein
MRRLLLALVLSGSALILSAITVFGEGYPGCCF